VDVLQFYSVVTLNVWFIYLFIRPIYSDETSIRLGETNEGLAEQHYWSLPHRSCL